jgi:hypothetical protein
MFKPIPGCETVTLSLKGQLQYHDGSACALPIVDGKVELTLYGRTQWWHVGWLALVAHYELFLPPGHEHRLFDIRFVPASPKLRKLVCGQIPVIDEPIEVKPGYRLVLSFPHLAVSIEGDVHHWRDGRDIDQIYVLKEYRATPTYTPDKSRMSVIGIHRLVAMAWVPNEDWVKQYIVNHRDGVRSHNHADNLEWVSYSGNSDHAVVTGARPEAITCRVLDTQTDQEHTFPSQRRAAEFMGLEADALRSLTRHQTPGRRILDRYEFRAADDERPWFSRQHGQARSGRYTIHLTLPDGTVEDHPDVRTFIRQFRVWNASSIEAIQARFTKLYPTIGFSYTDHFDTGSVQAYELATGRVVETPTIRAMEALTGDRFIVIRTALRGGKPRNDPKWLYRYSTDAPWDIDVTFDKSRPKRILATHTATQEQRTFDSLRACAAAFEVDRDLIKHRLTTGRDHQGWVFQESTSS